MTLAWALRFLQRTHESMRALEEGRARRPQDWALDLALAEYRAGIGDEAGADHLVELVRERAEPVALARTEAEVARFAGRRAGGPGPEATAPARLETKAALERSLSERVGDAWAVSRYCDSSLSAETLHARVGWVRERMEEQYRCGEALRPWAAAAARVSGPGDLLPFLNRLLGQRPGLPQVWSVIAHEQMRAENPAEAVRVATLATERFPMLPSAWSDLARAHGAAGNADSQERASARALKFTPACDRQ